MQRSPQAAQTHNAQPLQNNSVKTVQPPKKSSPLLEMPQRSLPAITGTNIQQNTKDGLEYDEKEQEDKEIRSLINANARIRHLLINNSDHLITKVAALPFEIGRLITSFLGPNFLDIVIKRKETALVTPPEMSTRGFKRTLAKCIAISPDNSRILVSYNFLHAHEGNETLTIIYNTHGIPLCNLEHTQDQITSANFNANGTYIITTHEDNTPPCIWDSASGKLLYQLPEGDLSNNFFQEDVQKITDAIFSPNDEFIASLSDCKNVMQIWNVKNKKLLYILENTMNKNESPRDIDNISFSPDSQRINLIYTDEPSLPQTFDIATGTFQYGDIKHPNILSVLNCSTNERSSFNLSTEEIPEPPFLRGNIDHLSSTVTIRLIKPGGDANLHTFQLEKTSNVWGAQGISISPNNEYAVSRSGNTATLHTLSPLFPAVEAYTHVQPFITQAQELRDHAQSTPYFPLAQITAIHYGIARLKETIISKREDFELYIIKIYKHIKTEFARGQEEAQLQNRIKSTAGLEGMSLG